MVSIFLDKSARCPIAEIPELIDRVERIRRARMKGHRVERSIRRRAEGAGIKLRNEFYEMHIRLPGIAAAIEDERGKETTERGFHKSLEETADAAIIFLFL